MDNRGKIFLNSVCFVLGFSIVFSLVGILIQTVLVGAAYATLEILRMVGGALIIAFGVFMIASLKYNIPFFMTEHKIKVKNFSNGYISSFVFGVAFAIGWTPCVGAILGSIYTLAAISPGAGFLLLLTYSLGIGIPFLIVGAFTSSLSGFLKKSQGFLKYFNIIGGIILIVLGILIFFNYIGIIATFFVGTDIGLTLSGQLSFGIAFVAGLLTFLSPCILPLVPAFLSYMAGSSANEVRSNKKVE